MVLSFFKQDKSENECRETSKNELLIGMFLVHKILLIKSENECRETSKKGLLIGMFLVHKILLITSCKVGTGTGTQCKQS
jgi:hypothetical protein